MFKQHQFDVLIIGSGASGLMSAIQLSENLLIALIAKDEILEGSTYMPKVVFLLYLTQKIILILIFLAH